MSGHGLSPAWRQQNEFARGDPWIFNPKAILAVFLNCDIEVDENDILIPITTLSLDCTIVDDENDILIPITTLSLDCEIEENENDILQPITTISLSCFTELV